MKAIGNLVLSATLFASCGQAAQTPNPLSSKDTVAPAAKAAPALTGPELHHYTSITGRFFDSIIGGRFNGSVLVAKNGTILYEKYKGFKYLDRKRDSIDMHTAFHLASVSKTFTAMATLKLWQEGKLDIHDSVNKYLPTFPADGTTVQMLLCHRSGLSNYVHFMDRSGWNKKVFLTNADVLQYISTHVKETRTRPPGKHFEYSNTNYALLALIIEKVSGLSYADYLSRTFFQPLGMQDTYVYNLSDTATAMESYYQNGRRFRLEFLDQVYGDKNIYSTVRDLYKWDQALRGDQLFSKNILDSAYAGYSFEKPGQRNYGLGWRMLFIPNGKKLIYHNGWWHGNRTVFVRMLDENATIIALCNNDYKRVYNAKRLSDLFGDYRQGQTFDDGDSDPSDPSGNGSAGASVTSGADSAAPAPVAASAAVAGRPGAAAKKATTRKRVVRTAHHPAATKHAAAASTKKKKARATAKAS